MKETAYKTKWKIQSLGKCSLGIEGISESQIVFPAIVEMMENLVMKARKYGGISDCAGQWQSKFIDGSACSVRTIISFAQNKDMCEFLKALA